MFRALASPSRFAAAVLAVGLLTPACADDPEAPQPDAEEAELETGRLGHIHVVVQPRQNDPGPEPGLRVEARFAEYRGLDDEAARLRANIPRDPTAGLTLGQCVATDSLGDDSGSDTEDL